MAVIEGSPISTKLTVLEEDAGLHFLVRVDTELSDRELTRRCADAGIRIQALSSYYHGSIRDTHCLVANYSGLDDEKLEKFSCLFQSLL